MHLTAPLLSFTAEEIWQYLPDKASRPKSVFLSQIPAPDSSFADSVLADKWERIFRERSEVLKALEQARSGGIIGHSLDAKVIFQHRDGDHGAILPSLIWADRTRLQDLLIVSQADSSGEADIDTSGEESTYDAVLLNCLIKVSKAGGAKCERCWKYDVRVGADQNHPTACARCAAVLNAGASA